MTEKAFEYCKPEDWADFLTAYPEAYQFLKERAQYREYLALRLQIHADTDNSQRNLLEYRLAEVEAEIVSWPYLKPQPRKAEYSVLDGGTHSPRYQPSFETTPTPPLTSTNVKFFLSLTDHEQQDILDAAESNLYDHGGYEGVEFSKRIRNRFIVNQTPTDPEEVLVRRREQAIKDITDKINEVLDRELPAHFQEAKSGDCQVNVAEFAQVVVDDWTFWNVPGYGGKEG